MRDGGVDDPVQRAERAFARGDTATAKRLAEARLRDAPDDEDALALLDDIALLDEHAASADAPASDAAGFTADNLSPTRPASAPAPAAPEPPAWGDLHADAGERPRARASGGPPRSAPPVGVILVAALHGLAAAFGTGIALIGLVSSMDGVGEGLLLVLAGVVTALLFGAVARGLWRLQSWAWGLAIVLSAVSLFGNLPRPGDPAAVFATVTNVVVIAYLLAVRGRFRSDPAGGGTPASP